MNKKSLLLVIPHLTIGGVQKTLVSASKALDYDKYDVTLYLRKNRTDLLEYIDKRINVIVNEDPHHYYRKPYAILLQLKILLSKKLGNKTLEASYNNELADRIRKDSMRYEQKKYFKSKKYDIAIAYVQGYTSLFVDKYVDADEKIIFYHTSVDELHDIHELILPGFDKIAALHEEQQKLLKKWYPKHKAKIGIVENYTDKELIVAQSSETEIFTQKNKLILCSCGRFSPVKGFDMAVKAAKILKDNNIDFIWYFVGDGPEKEKLQNLIQKYGLEENIIITGMQKNPYPYMEACNIYVQPSYEEAMPVTILEAHRLNKPVITTATVGGNNLVESKKNGLVCDINANSLAESVIDLSNNNDLYSDMINHLKNTDYSNEFEKYKEQWKNLLEG
ncbi:MAG: glycosyltransferase [Acutalibacteraceae bacterium]|nr:glycosyltransferase [Acutalibacteraceae bacterium]